MKISRTASFGIGVVVTLVIGSGTAYAATGGTFLLGKSNSASSTTTLANSRGTALSLSSKAGTAPLKVNRATKVTNLNSDQLDGLDSSRFALTTGQSNTLRSEGAAVIDADQDGTPDTVAAFAYCPAGTLMTGGGGEDYSSDGVLFVNAPFDRTSWWVVSTTADLSATNQQNVIAFVQCYNPRGGVAGGVFRATTAAPTASQLAAATKLLARKHR